MSQAAKKAKQKRPYTEEQKRAMVERLRSANVGRGLSEEHKAKLAAALEGKKRPVEIGAKIAARLKGRKHTNYRKNYKHSDATKEKLRGRIVSQETRERLQKSLSGRKLSEEHKFNISRGRIDLRPSIETRAKLSAANSKPRKPLSATHRASVAEAIRRVWAERRARRNSAQLEMSLGHV